MTASKPQPFHRRVYGRGVFEGLRMAGVTEPEDFMNAARLREAERNQTGIARKVLFATPEDVSLPASAILGDMKDKGINVDLQTLTGCLNTLKNTGLVREVGKGEFIRVPIPADKPALTLTSMQDLKVAAKSEAAPEAKPPADPLDRMAALAEQARGLAKQLTALAGEIEGVALDAEDRIKAVREDTAKLEQLRKLLQSIGT